MAMEIFILTAIGFFLAGCAAGFAVGWWFFVLSPSAKRFEQMSRDFDLTKNHIDRKLFVGECSYCRKVHDLRLACPESMEFLHRQLKGIK